MIRKLFKKRKESKTIDALIEKYKIPREYLSLNRKAVSRGVLVGLFWGFIPMPMQMLAVILTIPLLRFNVPLAISMVWLSNPLTMPAMYYMEYLTGNWLMGVNTELSVELTLDWFSNNWDAIVVPLYVGTAFYSIVVSGLIYLIINWLWIESLKKEDKFKRIYRMMHRKRDLEE
jgi:uncharacterized protein